RRIPPCRADAEAARPGRDAGPIHGGAPVPFPPGAARTRDKARYACAEACAPASVQRSNADFRYRASSGRRSSIEVPRERSFFSASDNVEAATEARHRDIRRSGMILSVALADPPPGATESSP